MRSPKGNMSVVHSHHWEGKSEAPNTRSLQNIMNGHFHYKQAKPMKK